MSTSSFRLSSIVPLLVFGRLVCGPSALASPEHEGEGQDKDSSSPQEEIAPHPSGEESTSSVGTVAQTEVPPAASISAGSEVAVARAAFQYRDFARVVEVLTPWLNPTKIADRALQIEARELQGVSLFLVGEKDAATHEFELLLRLDPRHTLDPFAIPPSVIEAFETVRQQMRDVLNNLLAERGQGPLGEKPASRSAVPGVLSLGGSTRLAVFMPFGAPQFLMDQPVRGIVYLSSQLTGLALNITGFLVGRPRCLGSDLGSSCVPTSQGERTQGLVLQYTGLGILALSWIISAIDGWLSLDAYEVQVESAAPQREPLASPSRG